MHDLGRRKTYTIPIESLASSNKFGVLATLDFGKVAWAIGSAVAMTTVFKNKISIVGWRARSCVTRSSG